MSSKTILATVFAMSLLAVSGTQLLYGRSHKQNFAAFDNCSGAWEYIEENGCASIPTPCPTDENGDTHDCNLWADPHVSGFDNTELKGPDYLYMLSQKESWDGKAAAHGKGKYNITYSTKMQTFDRRPVDVNALEAGDFWLVKNQEVHIQGRFRLAQEFLPDNAAIGAIAIGGPFLNGDKVIIEPLDGHVMLNAHPMPAGNLSMYTTSGNFTTVHYKENKSMPAGDGEKHADVIAELPMGVKLTVRRWRRHLDVNIRMPKLPGGVDGECGNMNGDPSDDTEDEIKNRMGDIMIETRAKLFLREFNIKVSLDEDGFNAVQASRHPQKMKEFIHLLLSNSEAQVLSESDLSGLIPYYNGEVDRKSYQHLVNELKQAEWVQGFEPPTKTVLEKALDAFVERLFR